MNDFDPDVMLSSVWSFNWRLFGKQLPVNSDISLIKIEPHEHRSYNCDCFLNFDRSTTTAMQYKLAVTVHYCHRHRAPSYLVEYCVPVSEVPGRQHLRSTSSTSSPQHFWGLCSFCRRNKSLWNSLPDHLRDPAVDSEQFRRDLKTYVFAGHLKRQRVRGVT